MGGDFRYAGVKEIHATLDSFTHIMNYFAAHPQLGIDMRFGTLSDYFELQQQRATPTTYAPTAAEFFPYSHTKDHYWSGYFASRASTKSVWFCEVLCHYFCFLIIHFLNQGICREC